jgi:hypothetical protein
MHWVLLKRYLKRFHSLDLFGGCHGINGDVHGAFLSLVPTPNESTQDPQGCLLGFLDYT